MADTLIPSEYELFPNRYRWTVQECYELAAAGRLVGRYEILDGEVVSKMGQKPAHAMTLTRLLAVMTRLFGPDYLRIQVPITLAAPENVYTEPEPDLAVTRDPAENFADHHPAPSDLTLVVEVADTTIRTDSIVKARLYARSAIPEYWIVDLNERQVHVYREPLDGSYRRVSVHRDDETVSTLAHPEVQLQVSDMLPPASVELSKS